MKFAASLALLALATIVACGRYDDFRLPPPAGKFTDVNVRWEARPEPVMARADGWQAVDVLNPSVIERSGQLLNLYSAYDGRTWHTGVATSQNGFDWQSRQRVLSPNRPWEGDYIAANGSVVYRDTEFLYWYQAGSTPRIGLARSRDGNAWTKHPLPVVDLGPRGSWDERGVADPYVIEAGGELFLFYLGQDRARRQRLGMARSSDGVHWWKLRTNPILELGGVGTFDENGLGEPAVWTQHGRWWMLYTGRDRQEYRRMGLAWSTDGVKWQRYSENAVIKGEQPWDEKVVCDATVLPGPGGRWRVWFGGGDVPHPAENIHGQIGYGELFLEPR
ncbi:MAG: hypothetical protein IT168_07470 [Bryobacterales bacterium]|nr:hypothetical protein [Bryobacterales bacterium]